MFCLELRAGKMQICRANQTLPSKFKEPTETEKLYVTEEILEDGWQINFSSFLAWRSSS
jgi:hypothetical protein